jgi:hypothetical protein
MIIIELEPKVWSLDHAPSEVAVANRASRTCRQKEVLPRKHYVSSSAKDSACRCFGVFDVLRPDFLYGPRFRPAMEKQLSRLSSHGRQTTSITYGFQGSLDQKSLRYPDRGVLPSRETWKRYLSCRPNLLGE